MPRHRGHGNRKSRKRGTNNPEQAAARDERADAARRQAAAEALAALEHRPPAPIEALPSPVLEPVYEPSKGTMCARQRQAIVLKYERLGCPPESEWGRHGGTLRQIADFLEMPDAVRLQAHS